MSTLNQLLSDLDATQESIGRASRAMLSIQNEEDAVPIAVREWSAELRAGDSDQALPFIYLANDVLQRSRRDGSMLYVNEFTKVLPTALAHTVEIAPSVKPKLIRILDIWSEREVIIRSEVDRLRSFIIHGTDPNPVNPVSTDDANAEDEEAQEAEREALEALEAAMNGGDGGAMGGGGGAAVMGVGSSLLTQCLHAVDSIRAQEVFLAKQVSDVAASEPHDAQGDSFSFKRKLQQNEALLQAVPVFVDQSAAYRSRLVRVLEAEIGAQEEALDIARMSKDKCEWMMNSLERAHALVDGGGTLRKRLKVAIPTDAGDGDVASGGRHGSGGRGVGGGSQTAEDDAEEDDSDDLALYGSTGTPRGGTPRAGGGDDGEGSGSRADSGAATTPGGSKVKGNAEGSASVIGRQDASSETEWCPITRTYRRKKGSGEDDHWRN